MADKYFFERVLPNPLALIWTPVVPISFYLVLSPINVTAGIVLGITTFAALLVSIWFAAPVIEVTSGQLSVGNASIPLELISKVEVISREKAFEERGRKLSPAAYTRFQPTVPELLKVYLADPNDPTPYWLFSVRKAADLAKTLAS